MHKKPYFSDSILFNISSLALNSKRKYYLFGFSKNCKRMQGGGARTRRNFIVFGKESENY